MTASFRSGRGWDIIALVAALILLMWFMTRCTSTVPIASTDTITRIKIVERVKDTTIYLTDSAGFRALLECDSLGQIRVKQINDYYAGQFVKPKVVIKDNYINVGCKIDSAAVYFSWKEHDTTRYERITTVRVPPPMNYVTGFQWFQIWLGRVFSALVIIYIGYQVVKRYTGLKLPF